MLYKNVMLIICNNLGSLNDCKDTSVTIISFDILNVSILMA